MIRKGFIKEDYTKINNRIAQDTSISLGARGVWIDLVTRPDDWTILPKHMAKQCGIGRDKIYRLLNELIRAGVCAREQTRMRTKDGREVLGKMEYVVYNDYIKPPQEKSVRPDFQDTDFQCPDFQYTENQDTTNKRSKETKEKKLLRPPPAETSPTKNAVVVVPSICLEVGGDAEDMKKLFKRGHTEDDIVKACELAKAQGTEILNFFGWVNDCIGKGYKIAPSGEEASEKKVRANKKWAHDVMDGKRVSGYHCQVLNSYLEFTPTAAGQPICFDYSVTGFQEKVGAHWRQLLDLDRGPPRP